MHLAPLIERKRDGSALHEDEWRAVLDAYASNAVPDYQMAALLMAVVFRGLTETELTTITESMLMSGERLVFGSDVPIRLDKHSTGGVGDKVSLVLAPLVASCDAAVPMMSGRGLGHTGGTLDKLESIPGFRTDLTVSEVMAQIRRIGVALFGQTDVIAPVDRRLYALRDVTGTVPSIPLIAASIMSKKLAEGLTGLVLDVKVGSGAFISDPDGAEALARTMMGLGRVHGCPTSALLTAMDRPLGWAIGNSLEAEEAINTLRGEGPPDLRELTLALAAEMLVLAGSAPTPARALEILNARLDSGAAAQKFQEIIEAQGGDPAVVDDPGALPQASACEVVAAERDGYVTRLDPKILGRAVVAMGGGRRTLDEAIDSTVGFVVTAKPGMSVTRGAPVATVYAADDDGIAVGVAALTEALVVDEEPPNDPLPLVVRRLPAGSVTEEA